jgi:hypothetical protein
MSVAARLDTFLLLMRPVSGQLGQRPVFPDNAHNIRRLASNDEQNELYSCTPQYERKPGRAPSMKDCVSLLSPLEDFGFSAGFPQLMLEEECRNLIAN